GDEPDNLSTVIFSDVYDAWSIGVGEDLAPQLLTLCVREAGEEVVRDYTRIGRAPALDMDSGNGHSVMHIGCADVHGMLPYIDHKRLADVGTPHVAGRRVLPHSVLGSMAPSSMARYAVYPGYHHPAQYDTSVPYERTLCCDNALTRGARPCN